MKNLLVSVIIPVYNTELYLEKCLKSVIDQTYEKLEIIVINDGSTDNSAKILQKFASIDYRIIYINQKNMGQANSRNNGINIAKGEFIIFIDSDDFIEENTIELSINLIGDNDIAVFGVNKNIQNNKIVDLKYKNKTYTSKEAYEMLLSNKLFNYSPCNKLFKSNLLKLNKIFFPVHKGMEDFLFILKTFFYANKIITTESVFYNYTQRVGSTSKIFNTSKIKNTIEVIKEIDAFVNQTNQIKYKKYFINLYYSLLFDTLSLIIRYSHKGNTKENLKKYFNEVKQLDIYSSKYFILLNGLNTLRFIKFKIYDLILKRI